MTTTDIARLVERLAGLPGSARLFNPYAPGDKGAPLRRENLRRYLLDMHERRPHTLLVAEAPGYRGCALTGIPVTSERIMLSGIPKWGLFGAGYRATSGHPDGVAEMTATILWGALEACWDGTPPLIWNTVPLHPHQQGQRQSNRPPLADEIRQGKPFLEMVLSLYAPRLILAVGRTAQRALREQGIDFVPLRHPSQGGKADFVTGLRQAHSERM